jgi:hypothetical protein
MAIDPMTKNFVVIPLKISIDAQFFSSNARKF